MNSLSKLALAASVLLGAMAGQALAAGDPAAGEKVFNKCKACHQVGETAKNAVAPELNGINGRKAAAVEGYTYSDALKGSGITWDEAVFKEFIKSPKTKVPGTKMVFPGLASEGDQDNVWAFLSQFGADGKKK